MLLQGYKVELSQPNLSSGDTERLTRGITKACVEIENRKTLS